MPRLGGSARRRLAPPKAARGSAQPPLSAPQASCRIEIPTRLRVVADNQRCRLEVRGRVLAKAALRQLIVRGDDEILFRTRYSEASGAPLSHGFVCMLDRPTVADTWSFEIIAQQRDGTTHRAAFVVAHAAGAAEGEVHSGPAVAELGTDDPLPPSIVGVERAALDPAGQLTVRGWAIALDPIAAVRVFSGAELLGEATHHLPRDDVAASHPEYPDAAASGFELSVRLDTAEPRPTLSVQAEAAGGHVHEIWVALQPTIASPAAPLAGGAGPELANRRDIRLFCDEVEWSMDGRLSVIGWAVSPIGIAGVGVSLEDEELGQAEFGLTRHDVGDEYVMIPMARHSGFRFVASVPGSDADEGTLRLRAGNALGDVAELTVLVRRSEAPPPPPSRPRPAAVRADGMRLQIDSPVIVDDTVSEPVGGRLTIDGWALSRTGVARIEMHLDGLRLDDAHYGLVRQDVAQVYRDWPNAARSGFSFHCPPRLLRNGRHEAELVVFGAEGERLARGFRFEVRKLDDDAESAPIRRRLSRAETDAYAAALARSTVRPTFRLILRQSGGLDRAAMAATLGSLRTQVLPHWRLVVPLEDARSAEPAKQLIADQAPDLIGRIDLTPGTAAAWPASDDAAPSLFGLLSPGDVLGCDALAEIALAFARAPDTELIYADEYRLSPVSGERERFHKPDFSPELLLATNYIGRPWFATRPLLQRIGVTQAELAADGEYDLLLRCTEQAGAVGHVPMLLCERAQDRLDPPQAERDALAAAAARRGLAAEVLPGRAPASWRLRRNQPASGMVSIIIPTCGAGGHIETCLNTLRERTAYRYFEIVCIENIPPPLAERRAWLREMADRVLPANGAFNWSRFNNLAAAAAHGEYLLFLNDDIEIEQPDWLDAMLEFAARAEIGVVGARLLYPDHTVQHAGMFLADLGVARHAFRLTSADDPGYFGLALTERDVAAVTGACMLMRHEHFAALGGFDEAHPVVNNDVDFCLRTLEAGRRVVFTPHATLLHHEQASRGGTPDAYDRSRFAGRWRRRFALGDPFHNPNLSKQHDDLRVNEEPVRITHGERRLFAAEEIRRILVIKVDHIGDFMTALPAIRRLKQHFPAAHIDVLTSPTNAPLGRLESSIDGIIPFEFFHARSALGQKTLDADALEELRQLLAPQRFDLAIDLRKHPETRELLRASGARFLAGFDYNGQFPWLDLALEWEGNRGLLPKRYHLADDLIHLADAVGTSAGTDRGGLAADTLAALREAAPLPEALTALFERPVVAVQPGSGSEMRQWPEEHFIALIELLVSESGVNVVLIGAPDEVALGGRILSALGHAEAIRSVIGEHSLEALAALLSRCALCVCNDSGPKHIAAAVGVPTVGIHSGNVDATEFGPIGPRTLAVSRQMMCSPCYLARRADCARGLACLRQLDPAAVFAICRRMLGPVADRSAVPVDPPAGNSRSSKRQPTSSKLNCSASSS